jgi:uncharacterized protein
MTNPFHYGSPVTGDRFTDRAEELKALVTCMQRGQNAVVLSPRRYGKTSLLKRAVQDVRQAGGRSAMVNLIGCSSRRQVAQTLATGIAHEAMGWLGGRAELVREHLARIRAGVSLEVGQTGLTVTLTPASSTADWSEVIGDVLRMLLQLGARNHPVSLVIDEFQRVAEIDDGLAGVFKTLVDELERVSLVFAGSKRHLMEELSTGPGAPLLKVGTRISLAPIPEALMAGFLVERCAAGKKDLDREVAAIIYRVARGIPNDVQQLAFWAFEEPGRRITRPSVERALDRVVSLQAEDFAEAYEKLAPSQQRLLEVLTAGPVADVYSRQMMQLVDVANANAIRVALRRLGELELVERTPAGWRVTSVFFERWLVRKNEF